ncbi:MAG TPA: GYF domain-containing protein [Anaeromyxobacter sp.]|nr:GYF domain-containing protein [Anaeromyxobacter sp.]
MKFTCDSCNAQYMISDDKVGPAGVKVRCKKCGHVIVVRRVGEPAATGDTAPSIAVKSGAGPSPSANGATAPGIDRAAAGGPAVTPSRGLDAELGSAFDHAFGDTPPSTAAPAGDADLGSTQAMGAEDAAKVFAATAPPPPSATEWYVAIGQAQVGPLPLGEVKKKWEAGDVGPDSLVWRPGMADWAPLTTVSDLAGFLAPVPRPAPQPVRSAARQAPEAAKPEPQPERAAEVTWKPAGASALAALASEELAARAPEARPAPVRPAGVKSLVDALPDGGGVDPTGALPLNIKALEPNTGERKIERRSAVARGAERVRHRRSATRALVVGLAAGVLLVGGAAAAAVWLGWVDTSRILQRPASAAAPRAASVPLPPPPVLPHAAAPQPPTAAQPAVAAAQEPGRPRAAIPEPRPQPQVAPPRAARPEPPPREPPRKEPQRVAAAQPPPPPPEPRPTKKGGDSILDFDSGGGDSALDDALGGGGGSTSKRSVYVPPARAGGGALPDKVSPGEINGAVAQRMEALRKCVSDQKAREPEASGTLKMRWMIQGDGSVRDVKCITPEYAQGQFAACIGSVVRSIRFPRSTTAGQEVTFPFNF